MLVLTRKTNEAICIGENIQITILSIKGGKVRLGFEAPQDVPIYRRELQKWSFSDEEEFSPRANCQPIA
jgi:carbon storage regulator CsrA